MPASAIVTSNIGACATAVILAISLGLVASVAPSPWMLIVIAGFLIAAFTGILVRHARVKAEVDEQEIPIAVLWGYRLFVPLAALGQQTDGITVVLLLGWLALALGSRPSLTRAGLSLPLILLLTTSGAIWFLDGSLRAMALILALGLLAIVSARLPREAFPRTFVAILDSIAIYLWLNIAAYYLLDLRSPAAELHATVGASTIDFLDERLIFPFSTALLTPAAMGAAYIAGYVATIRLSREQNSWFRLSSVGAAFFILLAANGRMPLFAAIFVVCLVGLWPQIAPRIAVVVAATMLIIPLWWPAFSNVAKPALIYAAENVSYLNRGEAEDVVTLQDRSFIWEPVKNYMLDQNAWALLAGYGPQGQISSGIYQDYDSVLKGDLIDLELASSHNSLLQQILDSGLLGLSGLLLTLFSIFAMLSRLFNKAESGAVLSGIAIVTVLCISGSTDIVLTSTASQETFWLLVVVGVLGLSYSRALDASSACVSHPALTQADNFQGRPDPTHGEPVASAT